MSDIPKAIWEGVFPVFGVPLRCYVLDNGQRIINADDMDRLFEFMGTEECGAGRTQKDIEMELIAFRNWQMSEVQS